MYLIKMDRDKYYKVVAIDIPHDCNISYWESKISNENEFVIDLRGIGKGIKILKNISSYKEILKIIITENGFVYEESKNYFR